MKVYLSGPIIRVDDYMERFEQAENSLKSEGYTVVNPARVNAQLPDDTKYEEYMAMSLTMLQMCDAIYLIRGWEQSRGANREMGYALAKGMKFIREGKDEQHKNPLG